MSWLAQADEGIEPDYSAFEHPQAIDVLKALLAFPGQVQLAAQDGKPSLVTKATFDIAKSFAAFYNHKECRVIGVEPGLMAARARLVRAVRRVLGGAFGVAWYVAFGRNVVMLTKIDTPRFSIHGRSLGGFYTSLHVPQLKALFDVGTALRSGSAAKNLFLSHAHADHIGSLPALLGMRGLTGLKQPLRMFMPIQLAEGIPVALNAFGGLHRWPLEDEPYRCHLEMNSARG